MRCTMLLSIVALGACSWMPRQGDLVFQVAGGGDMSQAIVDATINTDSLQFDHVAVFAGSRLCQNLIVLQLRKLELLQTQILFAVQSQCLCFHLFSPFLIILP